MFYCQCWGYFFTPVAGMFVSAFLGWLPKYLPELYPTRIRASGQGFSYNIGRVIAAFGTLYMGELVAQCGNHYGRAAGAVTLAYVIGMVAVWFAPETRGKPLPE